MVMPHNMIVKRGWRSFGDGRLAGEDGTLCVANLVRACDRIPDGATVTGDGSSGRVQIRGSV